MGWLAVVGVELGWLPSRFAWGQVAEDRRVAGGKTRRFFALFSISSYRLCSISGKRAGVGRDHSGKRSKNAESGSNAI